MKMNEEQFRELILSHDGTLSLSPVAPLLAGEYGDLILVYSEREEDIIAVFLKEELRGDDELDKLYEAIAQAAAKPEVKRYVLAASFGIEQHAVAHGFLPVSCLNLLKSQLSEYAQLYISPKDDEKRKKEASLEVAEL